MTAGLFTDARELAAGSNPAFAGHEQVRFFDDPASGLRAIVAMHSTSLGPAMGGCRMYPYASADRALTDALLLSRAMTYKNALAGVPFGGGKCVIIGHPDLHKTPALLRALAMAIDSLGGQYIGADDVGTTVLDMAEMRRVTPYAAGLADSDGNPCPATAWGVFHAIRAAAAEVLGRTDLAGLRLAVQGLGSVGYTLCELAHQHGMQLTVADVRADRVQLAAAEFGAIPVKPQEIMAANVDILAPCAMGQVLDATAIGALQCAAVVGAANNQLLHRSGAEDLHSRGIVYVPDFVANAGGVIDVAHEGPGYDPAQVIDACGQIYDTVVAILRESRAHGVTPLGVAEAMAEQRLRG